MFYLPVTYLLGESVQIFYAQLLKQKVINDKLRLLQNRSSFNFVQCLIEKSSFLG